MRKKGSSGIKNNLIEYYDLLAEDYNSRWVTLVDNQYKVIKLRRGVNFLFFLYVENL